MRFVNHGSWRSLSVIVFLLMVQWPSVGNAQNVLWGTSSTSQGESGYEQAATHAANGDAAGQVNAAQDGVLYGTNITVNTIGTQSVLDVSGSNNNITASQSGSNAGSVSGAVDISKNQ